MQSPMTSWHRSLDEMEILFVLIKLSEPYLGFQLENYDQYVMVTTRKLSASVGKKGYQMNYTSSGPAFG